MESVKRIMYTINNIHSGSENDYNVRILNCILETYFLCKEPETFQEEKASQLLGRQW